MPNASPLNSAELRDIDNCLDAGDLVQAQSLLAEAGNLPADEVALSYLATRLLFLRGRLDAASVVQRLVELLNQVPEFPEAQRLMEAATASSRPGQTMMTGSLSEPPAPGTRADVPRVRGGNSTMPPPPGALAPSLAPAHGLDPFPDGLSFESTGEFDAPEGVQDAPPSWIPSSIPPPPSNAPEGVLRKITVDTRHPGDSRPSQAPGRWGKEGDSERPHGRYSTPGGQRLDLVGGSLPVSVPPVFPGVSDAPPAPTTTASFSIPPAPALPSLNAPGMQRTPLAPPDRTRGEGRYAYSVRPRSIPPPGPRNRSAGPSSGAVAPWSALELGLWENQHGPVLKSLEEQAESRLKRFGTKPNLTRLAAAAAELLSTVDVTHVFAPYDHSLMSLARLDLALRALVDLNQEPVNAPNLVLLTGAYLGEVLRFTQRGEWRGNPNRLLSLTVHTAASSWEPFVLMKERFSPGPSPAIPELLGSELASPGTPPWFENKTPPRVKELWRVRPTAQQIPVLASAFSQSPVSLICREVHGQVLDGSPASIPALTEVLGTLTTSASALDGSEPWLVRLCMLAGAYVGEVIRSSCDGTWVASTSQSQAERYTLELTSGDTTNPVGTLIQQAIRQQPEQLMTYVQHYLERSNRS